MYIDLEKIFIKKVSSNQAVSSGGWEESSLQWYHPTDLHTNGTLEDTNNSEKN